MFNFFAAVVSLILTGDYQGWMLPHIGEEDSTIVDMILSAMGR